MYAHIYVYNVCMYVHVLCRLLSNVGDTLVLIGCEVWALDLIIASNLSLAVTSGVVENTQHPVSLLCFLSVRLSVLTGLLQPVECETGGSI